MYYSNGEGDLYIYSSNGEGKLLYICYSKGKRGLLIYNMVRETLYIYTHTHTHYSKGKKACVRECVRVCVCVCVYIYIYIVGTWMGGLFIYTILWGKEASLYIL
jgi:hypothetical protein